MSTGISWTDETWNPFAGCSKISAGCANCYAIGQSYRNAAMGEKLAAEGKNAGRLEAYQGLTTKKGDRVEWTGEVHFIPEALEVPLKWRAPRRVFVNSMSDLFHESIDAKRIDEVFAVMALTPHLTYQILTKRPGHMKEFMDSRQLKPLPFRAALATSGGLSVSAVQDARRVRLVNDKDLSIALSNVHLGVTIENQKAADERIPLLKRTPAALRFLSCEPLLEPIDLGKLTGIDWVIVGGESGPRSRDCNIKWIESIVNQCRSQGVAVWVKQLGDRCLGFEYGYKGKGTNPEEWPESIRFQEHAQPLGVEPC
jgi:protein gp37